MTHIITRPRHAYAQLVRMAEVIVEMTHIITRPRQASSCWPALTQ